MFENLEEVKKHYEEIMENLTIPEVVSDINQYKKLILEQSNLEPVYKAYIAFRKAEESEKDALFILDNEKDKDLIEMAKEELSTAKEDQERLTKEIQLLLLPKDENDDKNIVMEIRGGAGGEEAALFAGSLYRMYTAYAEKRGWKTELVSFNETGLGGLKVRCTPRAESSGNGEWRKNSYFHRDRSRNAGSGRCRGGNQPCRCEDGSFPLLRCRRTAYQ